MLDNERHVHAECVSTPHPSHFTRPHPTLISFTRLIYYNGHQDNPNSIREPGKRYTSMTCLLTHPFSRGSVHLASPDPLVPPAIDPNYLSNAADLDMAVHMLEAALTLFRTAPMAEAVRAHKMPSAEVLARGRAGLEEYVRENCRPIYHPVGTAAMLPREDGGVVDAKLRVYGTTNLRIVSLLDSTSLKRR